MTLREKFKEVIINPIWQMTMIDKQIEIADDFAIGFHRWMRKNDTRHNADKYFHYTNKDMLEKFKKEKGL